jgi:phage-related protein
MISSAILAVLSLIEGLIPILGTSAATATLVTSIINALIQLMPFIINEVSTVYTAVKNIIAQLQNSGAPTQEQKDALTQLDAQVDAAWIAIEAKLDPDNPANANTPAGDDPAV